MGGAIMTSTPSLAALLESFFIQRLMKQRVASSHTISSYRDTFRLLLQFAQIQRVLAIPGKRHIRTLVHFLTRPEVEALLAAPDQRTWSGRRDHALLLVAVQTGLRLSELTGIERQDVTLGTGAHIRVVGKGRKERCVPLTKQTVAVLQAWLREPVRGNTQTLFPNARGGRLSADGVQYLLAKHTAVACLTCPSLQQKRVTPHVLRHYVSCRTISRKTVFTANNRTFLATNAK